MKSRSLLPISTFALACIAAFATTATVAATDEVEQSAAKRPEDKPLEPYQTALLELAYSASAKFPLHPHFKSRAREIEAVAATCFQLDQPQRALRYIDTINNWRRGTGLADYAYYCAQNGVEAEIPTILEAALAVARENTEDERGQDWQGARILAKVALTHATLGQHDKAAEYRGYIGEESAGEVASLLASELEDESFDATLATVDAELDNPTLEAARMALDTCVQLYGRFYENAERRAALEQRVLTSWERLPVMIRVGLVVQLVEFALDHADQANALELVGEAKAVLSSGVWTPDYEVPVRARLAGLRYRAGDHEHAARDLGAALALFERGQTNMLNIDRANVLRSIAESYHVLGDERNTMEIYRRAVEAGVVNPNSRPRAVDLSATCRSMALHGVQPDPKLWKRMQEIHDALGDPW